MDKTVPFFYYDIFARIVPGGLLIAVASLFDIGWPKPLMDWISWLHQSGTTQAVLFPLIYGGAAYVFGASLDILLAKILRYFYRDGFRNALLRYRWFSNPLTSSSDRDLNDRDLNIDTLSKWSFDSYLVTTTMELPAELPHTLRFHAEAKCYFHSASILGVFAVAALTNNLLDIPCLPSIALIPSLLMLAFAILLLVVSRSRAERRADQILSFIDHFGSAKNHPQLMTLRTRLQSLEESLRPAESNRNPQRQNGT